MRKSMLLIGLILLSLKSYSQISDFIDTKRSVINDLMKVSKARNIMIGVTKDQNELAFDGFEISKEHSLFLYYNKADMCVMIVESNINSTLVYAIKDLNNSYKKIGENSWIDNGNSTSISLKINETYHQIRFKKI